MANEVRVLIKADAGGAIKEIETLDSKLGGLGKAAGIGAAALAGVGVAAAGGLALSVNAAANFEHALDQVGAVANATEAEMKGLSVTALRIGKDTAFSATEAAAAMEMLAANGVSVADIMNGAADAAVALAAAGGTDLATAADTASTAMAVWGLQAKDMADVVNRLAGAANVSRFGVEDMSQAIAMGGGAARVSGVEFADFASAIAAIAPNFSSGSDAGTSFKQFLAGLTPETKKAKEAFYELGLTAEDGSNRFFDANGNLKSMTEIVGILNTATKDLSEEQKAMALTTIFGSDAMRAAAGLAGLTAEEFAKLDQTMKGTDAADVAAKRMGNFKGSMEQLKGALETIQIEIGSKLLPVLTKLADLAAENLPRAFDAAKAKFEEWKPTLQAVGGALLEAEKVYLQTLGSIAAAIGKFVSDHRAEFEQFGQEAKRQFARFQEYYQTDLKPAFDNIVTAVEFVVQKFRENWDKIGPVVEGVASIIRIQIENIGNALQIVIDLLGGDWKGAWENTKQFLKGIVDFWKTTIETGVRALEATIAIAKDIGKNIIQGILDGAAEIWERWLGPFFKNLPSTIKSSIGDLSRLLFDVGKAIAQSLLDGLVDGAKAVWDEVSSWGGKIKSLKGPIEEDRELLVEEGLAIAKSLEKGLGAGFEDVLRQVQTWATAIKTVAIEEAKDILGKMKDVATFVGGPKMTDANGNPLSSIPTGKQYQGGGFYEDIPIDPSTGQQLKGPNGTVWDAGLQAFVAPWNVGSFGTVGMNWLGPNGKGLQFGGGGVTIIQNIARVGSAEEAQSIMRDATWTLAAQGL